jgi:hypothetical protein
LIFRIILSCLCLTTAVPLVRAQLQVSLSSRNVPLNGDVNIRYTLMDGSPEAFLPPKLSGLRVEAGPQTTTKYVAADGKLQRQTSYLYRLRPLKMGTVLIPPAGVRSGGQVFLSDTIRLQVGPAQAIAPSATAFAELMSSHRAVWVGQQFLLDIRSVLADSNQRVQLDQAPDFSGFSVAPRASDGDSRLYAQGRTYRVIRERYSLYPMRSGISSLSAPPLHLMGWKKNEYSPFVHHARLKELPVAPLDVEVRPLPSPSCADFSGAVGRYTMAGVLDKTEGSTAEIFTLRVALRGDGDPQRIRPPVLTLPAGLRAQPAERVAELELADSTDLRVVQQVFHYIITADHAGTFRLNVSCCFFDTDSAHYRHLRLDSLSLNINAAEVATPSQGDKSPVRSVRPWWWLLSLLPLSALLWGVFIRRKAEPLPPGRSRLDVRYDLREAAEHMAAGREIRFYEEMAAVLLAALGASWVLPVGGRTRTAVLQALEARGAPPDIQRQLSELLSLADAVKYAGAVPKGGMQRTYQQGVAVMEWLAASGGSEEAAPEADGQENQQ